MKKTFNDKGFIELLPSEGKVLFNGGIISKIVYVPQSMKDNIIWEEVELKDLYLNDDGYYQKIETE